MWACGAAAAVWFDRSHTGLGLAVVALLAYLFAPREREPTYGLDHEFPIESEEFLSTIVGATGMPFLPGNDLDIYNNGDEFYPVMLEAVRGAQVSVCIEAYIYWAGEVGRLFAEVFAEKAREGLPVKILLDAVGSATIGKEILEKLEKGGCEVEWYNPIKWYTIGRVNNRTHRKSLIIDGRIGFTGGAGIADHWKGNAEDEHHWRDIMVRLRGPAVVSLQTGFAQNWLKTTGELVTGQTYYPEPETCGDLNVLSVLSSPETGSSTVRIMYYLSIACARKNIFIANPYFVPDNVAVESLIEAKQRGVDVKIMVAGVHNDIVLTRLNSVRLYGRLLTAGIEIYEYNRTMMHHKYMVCDGVWSTIGTINFDNLSFTLSDEGNVCVYDRAFAARLEQMFQQDLEACNRIELEEWRDRGVGVRAVEWFSSLFKRVV